jgi:hypothetical protein
MCDKWKILFVGFILAVVPVLSSQSPCASEFPAVVELETLSNIYTGVIFDHAMHTDMTSCATCHHHTTGLPAEDEKCLRCHQESGEAGEVMCGGCHPANRGRAEKARALIDTDLFHNDTAGLKRAYHLKCMGCHIEMEVPSGCEDCHPKRDDNDNMASSGN